MNLLNSSTSDTSSPNTATKQVQLNLLPFPFRPFYAQSQDYIHAWVWAGRTGGSKPVRLPFFRGECVSQHGKESHNRNDEDPGLLTHSFLRVLKYPIIKNEENVVSSNQLAEAAATNHVNLWPTLNKKSCFEKEKQALLHFKASIYGDPFGLFSTWKPEEDDDCCNWSGITCNNQTGHVTKLKPKRYSLEGEISPSLVNLTYLNHLDLSSNHFDGTIPNFIGSMTQLRHLDLSWNNFLGTIPNSMGSLTQLRYLDLSFNSFYGVIPKSIGSLSRLRCLNLSFNPLDGSIPPELGNLTSLRVLSLETDEKRSSTIENLDWLSNLSHLQHLQMDGMSLAKANQWVDVISSLPKLSYLSLWQCNLSEVMHPRSSFVNSSSSSIQYLNLKGNNLNSSMYHWLFPLTSNKLLELDLSENILDGIPKYLGDLCSLRSLKLSNNPIAVKFDDFLNNLSGCTMITLETLDASYNQLTGSLSDEIQKFPSLVTLLLLHNRLNGTMSEKVWELPNLQTLYVFSNSLIISPNIGKSRLQTIDISDNSLVVTPSKAHKPNLYNVNSINMSYCNLGPLFPKWIQTHKNLSYLDISSNQISDTIPVQLWKTWPSRLTYLNLSSNNVSGIVLDLSSNFDRGAIVDLSSNNFYGPILNFSPTLRWLNLSKNKFNGGISFLCQISDDGFLTFLDLSHNAFTGQLPDCLWHFKYLSVLNLGHNNLSGRLPASIGYLIQLQSNNFSGTIPLQLCHLISLQILDLSMNNLGGSIPSCVSNLKAMVNRKFWSGYNTHLVSSYMRDSFSFILSVAYADKAMIEWQGNEREFTNNLGILTIIDLSNNNLTGQIPNELVDLHELIALNLSKNALFGEIPRKIGEMKNLLTLDLSRNKFSGAIPSSMSQMAFLDNVDMSHNSLSGRIPSSTQLQSFPPSSYAGNPRLCGPPLTKNCPGDEVPSIVGESESGEESAFELERWFYIGGSIGFATGFWMACGALLLNHRGRHAFFHFVDFVKDWVYVKVVVLIRKLERVANAEKSSPTGEAEAEAETGTDHESGLFSETIAGLLKREPKNQNSEQMFIHTAVFTITDNHGGQETILRIGIRSNWNGIGNAKVEAAIGIGMGIGIGIGESEVKEMNGNKMTCVNQIDVNELKVRNATMFKFRQETTDFSSREIDTSNQLAEATSTDGNDNGAINKKSCFHKEKQALLHFKASIYLDLFGTLSTWRAEDDDCCKWSGITCNNQTQHVIELHLLGCFLEGEISPSLVNLTYLNHLELCGNRFSGNIPNFIGSMTQLRYLDLSWNIFNGTIPKSIGSLTHLRYLDLSFNSLHGNIPLEFGNLTNLQNLSLGSSERYSTFEIRNLDWLSNLSHLQHLQMFGISLAKANYWVDVILSLQQLSYLTLRECDLSEVTHPYSSILNSSSSIKYLHLDNNNLNSSMYSWLFPLTSNRLLYLDLSNNTLDGVPKYLGNLCSLTDLQIDSNQIAVKFGDFLNNLSGCTLVTLRRLSARDSQFTGSVSDGIQKFSLLELLDLSDNHLSGTMSEKVWELPNLEGLDISSNSLVITPNIGKSKILYIDVSNNSLVVTPSEAHMSNIYYVKYIDLSACNLGPLYPKWIQTYKSLTYLDISGNQISDTIPVLFWKTWPSRLRYLNLSSNNISGKVPDLSSNFDIYPTTIDLSSNNFYGSIPNVPSTLASLNLSRNKFIGRISFLCQIVNGFLSFLDLSHNSLTGQLPDCLWHFEGLKVLNLGYNHFSGRLPASIGYSSQLEVLDLYNNSFSEELPLALKNCTRLTFLNLGANKFSGNVPVWIGENITLLYGLILRSNNFIGPIPLQLCHLTNLQILDLSMNNLNGSIPTCVKYLYVMVDGRLWGQNSHYYGESTNFSGTYVDNAMIEWQGNEREFTNTLGLLLSIDLSSNNLTGQIPNELTNLHGLVALNLSKNTLHGEIPQKIGEMKNLLTLDLSRNNFSGAIPSSMSQMALLNYLDMSHNSFSGRIPSSTQLQSFPPSRYIGNAGLCGPPITESCPGDEVPYVVRESEIGEESIDELRRWFYIGGVLVLP
ncbi:hypothetical protein OSB04_010297 [Centaurea solstitialis]|uniref:Leucine-rich repeat-containing N-terminal plant-type domain-containing protein n=1 Tax=Centaurea solstitialis TaxID=347529 RepID=A0AA38TS38_9ASTR|nr:hypothetical protein OSB04_010297 [Centaurea solstitialis]